MPTGWPALILLCSFLSQVGGGAGQAENRVAGARLTDWLGDYQTGRTSQVIESLSRLDEVQVSMLSLPDGADARTLATAALLHTEAGIRNGSYARRRPHRPITLGLDLSRLGEHYAKALSYVETLAASGSHEPWIETFVTDWVIATVSIASRHSGGAHGSKGELTAQALRWFPSNPALIHLAAFTVERQMGPEKSGPGSSVSFVPQYRSKQAFDALTTGQPVPGLVSTSHGRFSRTALQEAESLFRRALKLDTSLVAARVRLGRLLYLSDRNTEAARELERSLKEASAANNGVVAYWAALQLGLVLEQQDDTAGAVAAYRTALMAHPTGRSAHLALAVLQSRHDGADALAHALHAMGTVGADGRGDLDPWVLYPYFDYWRLPSLLSSLRTTLGLPGGFP